MSQQPKSFCISRHDDNNNDVSLLHRQSLDRLQDRIDLRVQAAKEMEIFRTSEILKRAKIERYYASKGFIGFFAGVIFSIVAKLFLNSLFFQK
jgi:hypothetical protein